jgi:hypothetical protein
LACYPRSLLASFDDHVESGNPRPSRAIPTGHTSGTRGFPTVNLPRDRARVTDAERPNPIIKIGQEPVLWRDPSPMTGNVNFPAVWSTGQRVLLARRALTAASLTVTS